MSLLRYLVISVIAPAHSRLVAFLAYGPWGFLHQVFIFVFKILYGIQWNSPEKFKTLGDFFLRSIPIELSSADLVSPVEGTAYEGPKKINLGENFSAKGICYSWTSFPEIDAAKFQNGMYWNLYLAPHNYHWVHAAASGTNLEGYRSQGAKLPVNALGRLLEPKLYVVNERLTFKFQTEALGEVLMICVGAMGVSALISDKGEVPYGRWQKLADRIAKGERLLGFQLGSTVLLLTEKTPTSLHSKFMLRVGDELVRN